MAEEPAIIDNPQLQEIKRGEIVLNQVHFRELMKQRKWDGYPQAAKALGVTRQRIQQLMMGAPVSADFIANLALLTGTDLDKSYTYYFEVRITEFAENHQRYNMAKYYGERPYEKFSEAAIERKLDGKHVEQKK